MTRHFFTSDWHLGHKRIRQYCPYSRKGDTVDDMNEKLVSGVIGLLNPGDVLYNLGDVAFLSPEKLLVYLKRIKDAGIVHHLILGNHDDVIRKNSDLYGMFDSVSEKLEVRLENKLVTMCHFPMKAWNQGHRGAFALHGHTHSSWQEIDGKTSLDVGIDTRAAGDMLPYSWREVKHFLGSC